MKFSILPLVVILTGCGGSQFSSAAADNADGAAGHVELAEHPDAGTDAREPDSAPDAGSGGASHVDSGTSAGGTDTDAGAGGAGGALGAGGERSSGGTTGAGGKVGAGGVVGAGGAGTGGSGAMCKPGTYDIVGCSVEIVDITQAPCTITCCTLAGGCGCGNLPDGACAADNACTYIAPAGNNDHLTVCGVPGTSTPTPYLWICVGKATRPAGCVAMAYGANQYTCCPSPG